MVEERKRMRDTIVVRGGLTVGFGGGFSLDEDCGFGLDGDGGWRRKRFWDERKLRRRQGRPSSDRGSSWRGRDSRPKN